MKTLRNIIALFLFIFFSGSFYIYLSVQKKLKTPANKETVEVVQDSTQLTFTKTV